MFVFNFFEQQIHEISVSEDITITCFCINLQELLLVDFVGSVDDFLKINCGCLVVKFNELCNNLVRFCQGNQTRKIRTKDLDDTIH